MKIEQSAACCLTACQLSKTMSGLDARSLCMLGLQADLK